VANLLFTRAAGRRREVMIRLALGAEAPRIVRQFLVESLVLSAAAGLLGLVLAYWGTRGVAALAPQVAALAAARDLGIGPGAMAFALVVALATGLSFGLPPALAAARRDVARSLREAGRGLSEGRRTRGFRNALTVAQIALSMVLLVGAGLLTQSLVRLLRVDPGFRPERLLTTAVLLPETKYTDSTSIRTFFQELTARIEALPGVTAVGLTSKLPLDWGNSGAYVVAGQPLPPPGHRPAASVREVSTGYFRAMGIPLVAGRDFSERDGPNAPQVIIVNRALAAQQFGRGSAVGERIAFDQEGRGPYYTIVGVVGNVPIDQLDETPTPTLYFPHIQQGDNGMFLVVRTAGRPASIAAAVRRVVHGLDPDLPVALVSTMEQNIANSRSVFMRRYSTLLIGGFAILALVLSVVGIYGVISYGVVQRTQELGVRIALGAQRRDIVGMILRDGSVLAAGGILLGSVAALGLTRFLRSLLFGVGAADPLTYVGVAALLVGVALLASYVPARRATRVDPLVALRTAE
jgi:putative ABC transport system permease protein